MLDLLDMPLVDHGRVASILRDVSEDPQLRAFVVGALQSACAGPAAQRHPALGVCRYLEAHTGALAAHARQLLQGSAEEPESEDHRVRLDELFRPFISLAELSTSSTAAIDAFLAEMFPMHLDPTKEPNLIPVPRPGALALVEDPVASSAVALAILDIPADLWGASLALRRVLSLTQKRQACGAYLLDARSSMLLRQGGGA
jgi:hypothetical protein